MTRWRRARTLGSGAAAACALVLAGCSGLPESGPVQVGRAPLETGAVAPFDFDPPSPPAGATPAQVVSGFLRALQAAPASTRVAEEYLTRRAAETWRPDRRTLVYRGSRSQAPGSGAPAGDLPGATVRVALSSVLELDGRGRWVPPAGGTVLPDRTLGFRLVLEQGHWRIADPPDATIVPETHFRSRYRRYALHWFDPTGSVLVPQPVYLPFGVQAPSLLLAGLVRGPITPDRSVERTYLPSRTEPGVSVPVGSDGVARVPLDESVLELGRSDLNHALAQIAWTLGQVEGVEAFQVTVDGSPVELPGGVTIAGIDDWPEYAPWVAGANPDLFGLRGREVVQVAEGSESVAASLGRAGTGRPRSVGVDLAGERFAVVSEDGRRVTVVDRPGSGTPPAAPPPYRGTDLLRPMFDHTGRLWLLDRSPRGTSVLVAGAGGPRRIPAPLGDVRVSHAALSRDGTRLLLAIGRPGAPTDRVLVARVVRRGDGAPVRVTAGVPVAARAALTRVRGVGWVGPATAAVLVRPSPQTSAVVLAAADGSSPAAGTEPRTDLLFDRAVALAASPGDPRALLVQARGGLHGLEGQRWVLDTVAARLRAPAFAG